MPETWSSMYAKLCDFTAGLPLESQLLVHHVTPTEFEWLFWVECVRLSQRGQNAESPRKSPLPGIGATGLRGCN